MCSSVRFSHFPLCRLCWPCRTTRPSLVTWTTRSTPWGCGQLELPMTSTSETVSHEDGVTQSYNRERQVWKKDRSCCNTWPQPCRKITSFFLCSFSADFASYFTAQAQWRGYLQTVFIYLIVLQLTLEITYRQCWTETWQRTSPAFFTPTTM